MDNDNKIRVSGKNMQNTEQRHKEVLLFLNDELNRLQTVNSADSYDLEKEYAKTKKNRSMFVFLILFISALVVFFVSWGITAGIAKQNEKITVNLQEFEGLNIKNLLDSVSKVQTNYDNAMKNKMNIISDRDSAIRKADEKKESDLFLIDSLTLDAKSEAKRKQAVYDEYDETIALINQVYDPQLEMAEKELAEYKKQLDEYDTSKLEAARKQEQALDSERRLHQLEIDKISEKYERRISALQDSYDEERRNNANQIKKAVTEVSEKYIAQIDQLDPDLTSTSAQGIVNTVNAKDIQSFDAEKFIQENDIKDESVIVGLTAFQKNYNQFASVHEPFEKIPYKKSAPSYLKASKSLVDSMGAAFKDTALIIEGEQQELKSQIASLDNKVNSLNGQIDQLRRDNEAEKQSMRQTFAQEKAELAKDYTGIYDNILASVKAHAVVMSAHTKEKIRIYVIESQRAHITEAGVGAEIKASKSVKGVIKPIADEPGFYWFESALDKAGNPIDFDFSLIAAGQIVKVSSK